MGYTCMELAWNVLSISLRVLPNRRAYLTFVEQSSWLGWKRRVSWLLSRQSTPWFSVDTTDTNVSSICNMYTCLLRPKNKTSHRRCGTSAPQSRSSEFKEMQGWMNDSGVPQGPDIRTRRGVWPKLPKASWAFQRWLLVHAESDYPFITTSANGPRPFSAQRMPLSGSSRRDIGLHYQIVNRIMWEESG